MGLGSARHSGYDFALHDIDRSQRQGGTISSLRIRVGSRERSREE